MNKKRQAMTFIEMIICLTILSITLVALVKGYSNYVQLSAQEMTDEALVAKTEALLLELEGAPPQAKSGVLLEDWHYTTYLEETQYALKVWNEQQEKTYEFLIQRATP